MNEFSNYQRRFRSNQLRHILRFDIYLWVKCYNKLEIPISNKIDNLNTLSNWLQEIFVYI